MRSMSWSSAVMRLNSSEFSGFPGMIVSFFDSPLTPFRSYTSESSPGILESLPTLTPPWHDVQFLLRMGRMCWLKEMVCCF